MQYKNIRIGLIIIIICELLHSLIMLLSSFSLLDNEWVNIFTLFVIIAETVSLAIAAKDEPFFKRAKWVMMTRGIVYIISMMLDMFLLTDQENQLKAIMVMFELMSMVFVFEGILIMYERKGLPDTFIRFARMIVVLSTLLMLVFDLWSATIFTVIFTEPLIWGSFATVVVIYLIGQKIFTLTALVKATKAAVK